MSRPRLVVAAAGLVLVLVGPVPAGGQQPPSESTVAVARAFSPSLSHYRSCGGAVIPVVDDGIVTVTRTEPLAEELVVPIEITGELAGSLVEPPASARFRAGSEDGYVRLELDGMVSGSLGITLLDEEGYALGEPSTADVSVAPPPAEPSPDCTTPLALDPARARQTIAVGEVPQSLGLDAYGVSWFEGAEELFDGRDLPPSTNYSQVQGALPPGLTYVQDRWGGAATTPGTYRFGVNVCSFLGAVEGQPDCQGTAQAEITVLGDAVPGPTAPPADAVDAAARFTG